MARFYAVEITTATGPMVSRYFRTIYAARKWARRVSAAYPTRILLDGSTEVAQ